MTPTTPQPPGPAGPNRDEGMSERIQDYLDGRLSDADVRDVEARVASDASWRGELESLRRLGDAVRAAMPDEAQTAAPEDFVTQVRRRIDQQQLANEQAAAARGRWGRILAVSYAAAALIVAAFTVHWMFGDRGAGTPTEQTAKQAPHLPPEGKPQEEGAPNLGTLDARARVAEPAASAPVGAVAESESDAERAKAALARIRQDGMRKRSGAKTRTTLDRDEGSGRREASGGKAKAEDLAGSNFESKDRKPGLFQPGGAVRPGLRDASDTPPAPTAPASPKPAKEAQAAPDLVVWVRAKDAPTARAEMVRLLALASLAPTTEGATSDQSLRKRIQGLDLRVDATPAAMATGTGMSRGSRDAEEVDKAETSPADSPADAPGAGQPPKKRRVAKARTDEKDPASGGESRRGRTGADKQKGRAQDDAPSTAAGGPTPMVDLQANRAALARLLALRGLSLPPDPPKADAGLAGRRKAPPAPVRLRIHVLPPK